MNYEHYTDLEEKLNFGDFCGFYVNVKHNEKTDKYTLVRVYESGETRELFTGGYRTCKTFILGLREGVKK